ncbi:Sporulation membrane protein YtrI [Lentibacillus sp. JNUCC-1]|uniref:sporulation membrane protein YtrI n=1 Tax=Lentibacillus sp. JNUCC-1 TaxID=2654513 RepID=UPI0012E8FC29|nr:sporulation membrane protein YtrI [Lentibacillus sp. JNUCC-1]MUV39333.1 Sporulation membrane protein YtrI [Lentibacillus sp. JNUCC-1]
MYVPPQLKKIHWQHAFIGVVFGGIIAYGIVMFMYGTMYEDLMEENLRLKAQITDLNAKNKSLKQDQEDKEEENKQHLEVQTISVKFSNSQQLRLDRLTTYQLEELVKAEIDHLIGHNLETVGENANLVVSTIENKTYHVDDVDYFFEVDRIILSQKLSLLLKIKMHQ